MCFSNLPVEFDDQGDPYLAEDADDVERVATSSDDDTPLDADPGGAYAEIVRTAPASLRASIESASRGRCERAEGD